MGLRNDIAEYLRCELRAEPRQIIAAVTGSVSAMGKHAVIGDRSESEVLVYITPGLVQALSHRSPHVHVHLAPAGEAMTVTVRIGRYTTTQPKYLFIPVGPKRLVGRSGFRRFLDLLEAELVAIDSDAERHRGNSRREARSTSEE